MEKIVQNKPCSRIVAGDLRSRSLHVDPHAELHHVENDRPADSAPYFVRLARFSFNWPDPPSKKSQKQLIPATQNRFSGGTFIASECTIYYLFFFCYLFSTPPGGI